MKRIPLAGPGEPLPPPPAKIEVAIIEDGDCLRLIFYNGGQFHSGHSIERRFAKKFGEALIQAAQA